MKWCERFIKAFEVQFKLRHSGFIAALKRVAAPLTALTVVAGLGLNKSFFENLG